MAATFQTLANCYSQVRFLSGKDSTSLSDANLLRLANKSFNLIMRELLDVGSDLYSEIASAALVANQMEYSLPADSVSTYGGGAVDVERVEISYDGTNWYVAQEVDLTNLNKPYMKAQGGDTTAIATLNLNFDKTEPRFAFADRSIWIAPIPVSSDSVAAGNTNLRIYWVKRPNEMTATTDIPELPKDFLNILTEGMLQDVFISLGRVTEAELAGTRFNQGISTIRRLEYRKVKPLVTVTKERLSDYE